MRFYVHGGAADNQVLGLALTGTGNLGIGGGDPATYALEVEGDASKTGAGGWKANPDQRIKTNISSINDAVSP